MRSISKIIATSTAAATLFLSSAQSVLAQARCEVDGKFVPCPEVANDLGAPTIALLIGCGVFFLVVFIFWLMMLRHVARNNVENKTIWLFTMIFIGPIVAVVYYFVVKRNWRAAPPHGAAPTGPTPNA
jgi:hypothetical protein